MGGEVHNRRARYCFVGESLQDPVLSTVLGSRQPSGSGKSMDEVGRTSDREHEGWYSLNTQAEAPVRAATYLGDNSFPIMGDLVRYLAGVTGIEVALDTASARSTATAYQQAPALDLVWMCGYPTALLISTGRTSHEVVAAPIFAGHGEPIYHSVIIARADGPSSLRAALETRLAVNEVESWSGFLGLKAHIERSFPGAWFVDQTVTGSHRASIQAVADQACDVAAIDITIWEHVLATEPAAAANVRVIDRTADWPAPPFTLGSHLDPTIRKSLTAALVAVGPVDVPSLDGVVAAGCAIYRDVMLA